MNTLKRYARNSDVLAVCFIFLTIGLFALISCSEWLFEPVGFLDTWYYIAYGHDYLDKDFLNGYYKISRLPWVLLQFAVRHTFSYLASEYVLTLGCLGAGALGAYFCVARLFGRKAGVTIALMLAVYTHYHGSGGWNYHNTIAGPLYLWTYFLFMKLAMAAESGRRSLFLAFVTGAFLALTIHSNVTFVNFAALLGIMYLALRYFADEVMFSWRRVFAEFLAVVSGAVAVTLLLGVINKAVGRDFLFFMGQFRTAASFIADKEHLKSWWKPLSGDWLKTAYYLSLPFAVFVVSLVFMLVAAVKRKLPEGRDAKVAFCMLAQHVLICLVWTAWHQMGQVALDWNYFAYPLIFPSFMALAALPVFFRQSAQAVAIKSPGDILFFILLPAILLLPLLSFVSLPPFGKSVFGIWQVLYPSALFMIACLLFLFSRQSVLVLIASVLVYSWGNVNASHSLNGYAYSNKSTLRRDHYLAILQAREQILAREKKHMKVDLWFDESEDLKVSEGETIKFAYFAYALTSTGFQYYIKAWPLPKVSEISVPELLKARIWENRLLVTVSTNQAAVEALIDLHKAAGLNVTMHDIVEMKFGTADYRLTFSRFGNTNPPEKMVKKGSGMPY